MKRIIVRVSDKETVTATEAKQSRTVAVDPSMGVGIVSNDQGDPTNTPWHIRWHGGETSYYFKSYIDLLTELTDVTFYEI